MIFIITIALIVGFYFIFHLLKKDNPELRIYRKRYSCSVCGNEFDQALDCCPHCAKETHETVLLHESFVEISPG